jgi:hypothetical protein
MALVLTFEQSNSGKTLTITEASTLSPTLTGAHITISTVTSSATTEVYDKDMSAEWIAGDATTLVLTADDLDQTADTAFTDGVYKVVYSVTDGTVENVEYNVLLDYNVKYCVYNLYRQLPDIHASNTLCTNKQVERVQFMGTFLKSLEYSAACGQVNEILTILASLQNLCLNTGINECYCN